MTGYRILPIVFFSLLALSNPTSAAAQRPSKERPKPSKDIEIKIKFSVKELDPKRPRDSYLECTLRNKTDKAIRVPTVYTYGFDTEMLLHAHSYPHSSVMRMFSGDREKKKQEYTTLKRGEELTIFKAGLSELLKLTEEDPKKKPSLVWSWQA